MMSRKSVKSVKSIKSKVAVGTQNFVSICRGVLHTPKKFKVSDFKF